MKLVAENISEALYSSQKDVFTHKNNPNMIITVYKAPDGRISAIENPYHLRFPFSLCQILTRNVETWACNNNYLINGEDPCGEKKIFGIKASDIPRSHELRTLFKNKF